MSDAWVGVVGVCVGVLLTLLGQLATMRATSKREDRVRFVAARQAAYAELLAVLDDIAGDDDGEVEKSRDGDLNRAYAVVDLLAPQPVCDAATRAHEVAWLRIDNPARIAVMERLVTAMRTDLGVTGGAWKQSLGTSAPLA